MASAEWTDALVIVEAGSVEVHCRAGACATFAAGDMLALGWLAASRLRNVGPVEASLVTIGRKEQLEVTGEQRVDSYIDALPAWQQAICREVRDLVHQADPEVVETIKRTVLPYFVLAGNICALQATRDHVNVFLYDPLVDDPEGIITAGHGNKTGRQIAIYQGDTLNRPALVAMFRQIIRHNRAGGWRKLEGSA